MARNKSFHSHKVSRQTSRKKTLPFHDDSPFLCVRHLIQRCIPYLRRQSENHRLLIPPPLFSEIPNYGPDERLFLLKEDQHLTHSDLLIKLRRISRVTAHSELWKLLVLLPVITLFFFFCIS
ncbi:hypothetical protein CDAR_379421 [Caerostris darwini]|uniref:Uncharacterized protein n=1 Tax=Caerostris darwini TaxID=1538125 RepID=A0AAV4VBT3_9ARAC|nr:hypothetical protein CDAR_379421 [Caerostris darwini]